MRFKEKLKNAMKELNLTQTQISGLTGKSKASISQYLSGSQIPSPKVQSDIAVALGLEADYFEKLDDEVRALPVMEVREGIIQKMPVITAAKLLQVNSETVRKGLQQGVFPWGYAIHTSPHKWVYFINARRFMEIEGVKAV